MRRSIASQVVLGLALVALAALTSRAATAGEKPVKGRSAAVPYPVGAPGALDLRLRGDDLKLQPERRRPRGYAATLRDDPWRALAEGAPRLAGTPIPQSDAAEDEAGGQLSLRGLLDGETFPVLRIRLSPPG